MNKLLMVSGLSLVVCAALPACAADKDDAKAAEGSRVLAPSVSVVQRPERYSLLNLMELRVPPRGLAAQLPVAAVATMPNMPNMPETDTWRPLPTDFYQANRQKQFSQPVGGVATVLLDWYLDGKLHLSGAHDGRPAILFLVSPVIDGGVEWRPTAVTRAGNSVTVEIDQWNRDHGPVRESRAPEVCVFAMPLGNLPHGKGELSIHCRQLQWDRSVSGIDLYRCASTLGGQVPLSVASADTEQPTLPTLFRRADLKEMAVDAAAPQVLYQEPVFMARKMRYPAGLDGMPRMGVWWGTFDLAKWTAKAADLTTIYDDRPNLVIPKPGDPCYAYVLGSSMGAGDWMSLREIAWEGGNVTYRVDLWHTGVAGHVGSGPLNQAFFPLQLVPYPNPRDASANHTRQVDPKLDVTWTELYGAGPTETYTDMPLLN